jgi:hypothetical protein
MEDDYPGLWRQWFKHQCVAVGYPPELGFRMKGGRRYRDWTVARNSLREMDHGDLILVALPQCRIGRIGKVLDKKVEDSEWDPLVSEPELKQGKMGRRIFVHWELAQTPDGPDQVIQLPSGENLGRGTLTHIRRHTVKWYREIIANPGNWVGMVGRFGYERALSDYITLYPHRLEAGLRPHPSRVNRERVLVNRSRLDVLLIGRDEKPVIVESKQDSPTVGSATVGEQPEHFTCRARRWRHCGPS